jgi:hypothetical protein
VSRAACRLDVINPQRRPCGGEESGCVVRVVVDSLRCHREGAFIPFAAQQFARIADTFGGSRSGGRPQGLCDLGKKLELAAHEPRLLLQLQSEFGLERLDRLRHVLNVITKLLERTPCECYLLGRGHRTGSCVLQRIVLAPTERRARAQVEMTSRLPEDGLYKF